MKKLILFICTLIISLLCISCIEVDGSKIQNNGKLVLTENNELQLVYEDGTIESLGTVQTIKGDSGSDGKSAYEIWLSAGNTGTLEDFLASLKGEKGSTGKQGLKGESGEKGEQGIQGEQGPAGINGTNGINGLDGKGISNIKLEENNIIIFYTDGTNTILQIPECTHEFTSLTVREHTKEQNGLYLKICTECGISRLEESLTHDFEIYNLTATCYNEGIKDAQKCSICGLIEGGTPINKLAHEFETTPYDFICDGYACQTESIAIKHCTRTYIDAEGVTQHCDGEDRQVLENLNCQVAEYKIITSPTHLQEGNAMGQCAFCNNTLELTLPKLGSYAEDLTPNYVLDDTQVICNIGGTQTWTWVLPEYKSIYVNGKMFEFNQHALIINEALTSCQHADKFGNEIFANDPITNELIELPYISDWNVRGFHIDSTHTWYILDCRRCKNPLLIKFKAEE